jgi:hypothetical protein
MRVSSVSRVSAAECHNSHGFCFCPHMGVRAASGFPDSLYSLPIWVEHPLRSQSRTVAEHIAADAEAQALLDDWATREPLSP